MLDEEALTMFEENSQAAPTAGLASRLYSRRAHPPGREHLATESDGPFPTWHVDLDRPS